VILQFARKAIRQGVEHRGANCPVSALSERRRDADSAAQSPKGGVCSGPMTIPVALPAKARKRGNPNWGHPTPLGPALPTEFDLQVRQLQLTAQMYTSSAELRAWCEQNRNRCYVPEWLLAEWCITVDSYIRSTA